MLYRNTIGGRKLGLGGCGGGGILSGDTVQLTLTTKLGYESCNCYLIQTAIVMYTSIQTEMSVYKLFLRSRHNIVWGKSVSRVNKLITGWVLVHSKKEQESAFFFQSLLIINLHEFFFLSKGNFVDKFGNVSFHINLFRVCILSICNIFMDIK